MTVRELRDYLSNCDDDAVVVARVHRGSSDTDWNEAEVVLIDYFGNLILKGWEDIDIKRRRDLEALAD